MSYTVKHPGFLDCQVESTGSYAAGTTTWTFSGKRPYTHALYKPTGQLITLSTANHTAFTASGDYSGGASIVGFQYETSMILAQPFMRDANGQSITSGSVNIKRVTVRHRDTINYTVETAQISPSKTVDHTYQNESGIGSFGIHSNGEFNVWIMCDASNVQIYVKDSNATPMTITGIEWDIDYTSVPRWS